MHHILLGCIDTGAGKALSRSGYCVEAVQVVILRINIVPMCHVLSVLRTWRRKSIDDRMRCMVTLYNI